MISQQKIIIESYIPPDIEGVSDPRFGHRSVPMTISMAQWLWLNGERADQHPKKAILVCTY